MEKYRVHTLDNAPLNIFYVCVTFFRHLPILLIYSCEEQIHRQVTFVST